MKPLALAEQYAATLTAAGIRATTDPRNVTPPCVLLRPPSSVRMDIGCGGTAEMVAVILAAGPGQREAWAALETLTPAVLEHLPAEQIISTTYTVDDSGAMPAYELVWTALVDWNQTP